VRCMCVVWETVRMGIFASRDFFSYFYGLCLIHESFSLEKGMHQEF
jgi:hypothetical protein